MNLFILGDIHGCYHTFQSIIKRHWDIETEMLIGVGDLIDRGNYSPQTVEMARSLMTAYPDKVVFLKGNHEYEMVQHFLSGPNDNWLKQCGKETLRQYKKYRRAAVDDVAWFQQLPLFWENDAVLISHAGIAAQAADPFNEDDELGILWNRSPLRNMQKVQIMGHTPGKQPIFHAESNAWNIDTGAVFGRCLTGVKLKEDGELIDFLREDTDWRDIDAKHRVKR
ncbi:metallophosphoesterase family protein [Paenibacillus sp. MBLB4367]|uniref:metallophosphoesterase family protein n=1 Tax=Paenibacillus sp. MBLB4367 TaxID=3384767 RepID=UPI003908386F